MKNTKVVFDNAKLQYSAALMRALAHPLRLRILEYIDSQQVTNVNKIYMSLSIEQSITSQHLRILKMVDAINCEKDGKYMYYSVNYDTVSRAKHAVDKFLSA